MFAVCVIQEGEGGKNIARPPLSFIAQPLNFNEQQ